MTASNHLKRATRPGSSKSGMSLVEVMISLAISVTLLVAIAAAFSASSAAIQSNDEFNRASQASRIALNQILAEVRKCKSWVLTGSTKLELTTVTAAGTDDKRTYEYDAVAKQLTLCFPLVDPAKKYPLVRGVTSAAFAADADSVSLNITIEMGKHKVSLSGSGTPRRTIVFD